MALKPQASILLIVASVVSMTMGCLDMNNPYNHVVRLFDVNQNIGFMLADPVSKFHSDYNEGYTSQ